MNEVNTVLNPAIVASLVLNGDIKNMNEMQRVEYYNYRCNQAGLDPAAKPFDLLVLNGKMVLYANASCTQQLTAIHKLSHKITSRELVDDIYCVCCQVTGSDGRITENMGAVPVAGLKGEQKANALMKATTKAIRRTVLAHCGLGLMDETEVSTIPGAKAEKWVEPETYTWTEDDIAEAKRYVLGLGDMMIDWDVSDEDIVTTTAKAVSEIGKSNISFNTWANRFNAFTERVQQKFAPVPEKEVENV